MKDCKGFTLVELLAVIVILAIVLAIAIPGIGLIISSSKISTYNSQMAMIQRAASLYAAQYGYSSNTSINLDQLKAKNLIPSDIINPITNKPFDNIVVNVRQVNNATEYEVYEGPTLVTGLIPVYYDEAVGTWKKADKTNASNNWYDYNNYKWANAVAVTTSTRNTYQSAAVGTAILESDVLTYFVWIPRYKYRIPSGTGPREILINFETRYIPKSTGDAVNTYYTHPAFTFGGQELNGIWVGKFEMTGTVTTPTIKPNLRALDYATLKAIYDSIKTNMQSSNTYGFTNDSDIHMMKNTEWGAAAYLSHSRYGKYGNPMFDASHKEIYLNNSSGYYTGRSSGSIGGSGVLTTLYDGSTLKEYNDGGNYTYDGKCSSIYAGLASPCTTGSTGQILVDKTYAYGASAAGTIYGIYDMSGGSYDYVMGLYKPNPVPATGIIDQSDYSTSTTNSQYDLMTINSKYYDQYLTNSASTGAFLGDATKEVSGWYSDTAGFVDSNTPWFARGNSSSSSARSGAFSYSNYPGSALSFISSRAVLDPLN